MKTIIIVIITSLLICLLVIYLSRIYVAKTLDTISNMLGHILSKKDNINIPETIDTRQSKLAHQVKSIIEMINYETTQTEREKEIIKELISDISHQIKTPLANISMNIDILLNQDFSNNENKEFLIRTKEESDKINWLIKSLLKMSRLETGVIEFTPTYEYIKETIAKAVSFVYTQAKHNNIEIKVKEFDDVKLLHNRKWTSEALTNILENAIKYSPENSSINIKIIPLEIYTIIEIADEGIGIDEKDFNNIFKRFYRGENVANYKGMGIGLYISQLILNKEGGYITVKSKLGKGSIFSVFLQN